MNDNPEGTPNPLNPNPMAGGMDSPKTPVEEKNSQNVFGDVHGVQTSEPSLDANPSEIVQPETPSVQNVSQPDNLMATIESLDPTNRPMEQKIESAKPKKKTGLIIFIIILVLALIGGGVAVALVLLNQKKPDVVATAMQKIMNGDGPTNVAVAGTIDIAINDKTSPITNLKIDLNSEAVASSLINTSKATITATLGDKGEFTTYFDEVYAANGDLYFKIDGITDMVDEAQTLQLNNPAPVAMDEPDCAEADENSSNCVAPVEEVIDCESEDGCQPTEVVTQDPGTTSFGAAYLAALMNVVEMVDGQWLRISTDDLGLVSNNALSNSNISCLANMMSDINSSSYSIAESYNKNPFISSTSENIPIVSVNNPVYQINIDSANLASFIDGIQNSILAKNLYSCLGWHGNVTANERNLSTIVDNLPTLYVEIDDDFDFTRLYLDTDIEGNPTVIDLSFTYPNNVNVSEPLEYRDFSQVIQEIFTNMYNMPVTEIDSEAVVIE